MFFKSYKSNNAVDFKDLIFKKHSLLNMALQTTHDYVHFEQVYEIWLMTIAHYH